MVTLAARIQGNTVLVDDSLAAYDGREARITIFDAPGDRTKNSDPFLEVLENGSLVIPTELANRADEYVRGLRENDRV